MPITFRKSAIDLLDNIGTAQMQQEALGRIRRLVQDNQQKLEEETGISSSLTEDDVKEYLEQVSKEVKKKS